MSLIQIENLTFSYYGYDQMIFDNVSLLLDTNWRTGLIGRNGVGKSTLFKLLLNEEKYEGKIYKSVDFIKFPFDVEDASHHAMELFDTYVPQGESWRFIKETNLLQVEASKLYLPYEELSKGEQTKILLAMLFTIEKGFLLIDEPTNHLDKRGRQVVSDYLKSKSGFILISHDRTFLDGCIDHVISINRHSIDVQQGNFSSWEYNKRQREQFELTQNERLKKDIHRLKEASQQSKAWSDKVEKTKKGTKISGLKPDTGRIGHLAAKMMKRSKNLEHRQHKAIEEKQKLLKDVDIKEKLSLQTLRHHKHVLCTVEHVSAYFDTQKILKDVNFEVQQGDRVAIVGKNGSGKSTLLKLLLGQDIHYTGHITLAKDLTISYVSQDTSHLIGHLNDYIHQHNIDETRCKTILRKLDFERQLFDMSMENYSEGQKKKVLIAASLAQPAHLFIWDEPLNYIDVISRMQIETLILDLDVTLIFVEHDKQFTEAVATKTVNL